MLAAEGDADLRQIHSGVRQTSSLQKEPVAAATGADLEDGGDLLVSACADEPFDLAVSFFAGGAAYPRRQL
ncbi:hypothetical protein ABLG96_20545 [Nakamurella sp. A5-74]|uniref:Uncharacterized protein n=1 Tax=Nakamurella sp. A5-74 TaxID=3158264 RepID=A0AAU8DUV7_9ACTN